MAYERTLVWLLLVFTLLAFYAAWSGHLWSEARHEAIDLTLAASSEPLERRLQEIEQLKETGIPPRGELSLPQGIYYSVALPAGHLASLSIGQAESFPFAARFLPLTNMGSMFENYSVGVENPSVLAAGRFDLAFVVIVVMPLLLLACTYDLWTDEKDSGTAALILAQPVSPIVVLLGKALARGGVGLVAMTVVVVIALVAASWRAPLSSLLAPTVIVFLYGSFWIAAALAINVFFRSSAEAAVACGTLWIVLIMVVPAVSASAIDVVRPSLPQSTLTNARRAATLEAEERGGTIRAMSQPGFDITAFFFGRLKEVQEAESAVRAIEDRYDARDSARRLAAGMLRLSSPATIAQDAFDRVAGSDADRALAFVAQSRVFLQEVRRFTEEIFTSETGRMTPSDYERIPIFAFEPPRSSALIVDFIGLLAMILIVLTASLNRIRQWHHLGP